MSPFRRKPRIIEVQPPDHDAYVERRTYRIEHERGAWHMRSTWHDRSLYQRAKHLCAFREFQGKYCAAKAVHQAETGCVICFFRGGGIIEDVVCDIHHFSVWNAAL